ncbi:hypothetical protein H9Y04_26025 [Streptomyces sp. TRM66268-LWL]|uniref:Uncharacterized protein n=1 Tax=Streptomyces polyasparticus TaxID=2767826 RepID=A0ABR7SMC7_9ACTN|nr:hypothetical protein [Streptomyces polyasparticus]MBC9716004.1 hypothetical protein [Streptomyces polyasparticus]
MNLNLFDDVPDGLTRRARSFVAAHGVRVDVMHVEEHRQWWLERDIPAAVVDRMATYRERWGGLVLPPASQYDGGPRYLEADSPEGAASEGWSFVAGHASKWARRIDKVTGDDVDGIVLDGFEPVREVRGLADTWWRGADSLVAVYTGMAEALSFPRGRTALIYGGLDEWGLYGGVEDSAV